MSIINIFFPFSKNDENGRKLTEKDFQIDDINQHDYDEKCGPFAPKPYEQKKTFQQKFK